MTYHPISAPADRPTLVEDVRTIVTCGECGSTLAHGRECLEVGSCASADLAAARTSSRGATAKYAVPAAWNARGMVD